MTRWISRWFAVACVGAALGSGCGYSEEEMQVQRDRVDQLTSAINALEQKHGALQQEFDKASTANAALNDQLRQMGMSAQDSKRREGELKKLIDQLREKERQDQARLSTFRNMLERFNKMIQSGKLRVRIVRNRMVVELAENILFDSGKAELKPELQQAVDRCEFHQALL